MATATTRDDAGHTRAPSRGGPFPGGPPSRGPRWRWPAYGCVLAGGVLALLELPERSPAAGPGGTGAGAIDASIVAGDPDGDGVPGAIDALPFLDTEAVDTDGDGFGDSQDRFPHDPERARPVELLVNGTFDAGSDGWSAEPGAGAASHAAYAGRRGSALGLVSIDADAPPAWVGGRIELEPDTVGLRVAAAVRGRSGVELRFEVRHRDPLGTSTVVRSVVLSAVGDDDWHVHEASVELPSRAISVRPSIVSTGGATLVDDLSLQAERATDADGDGIDDRVDPDDDGDGYVDGEDPAPLDPRAGPLAGPATGPDAGPARLAELD